ncbi:MAG: peptide-methionine (S)-S-oxide reductase MsrA [Candidatus Moranbacteria bacterium]|nr:peptide-methionine (S)-S-oxide reductase MsrA [Candidatus Moranbacteria bacterium]
MNTQQTETAYFAGGCFWGVEYWMKRLDGVLSVRSGYMGGTVQNPTYEEVCTGKTGHAETVEVIFDSKRVSYRDLVRRFFEIHDPTELNRQGPDIGTQYRSAVFYTDEDQKRTAESLIGILRENGYDVVTELSHSGVFHLAEDYHQNYYGNTGHVPYCHVPTDRPWASKTGSYKANGPGLRQISK